MSAQAIPPFRLVPKPLNREAQRLPGFKWAGRDVGKRHQLGGEPDWIQEPEIPACESCGEAMTFYGQLDSINDEFILGDCGLVYVFVCLECLSARVIVQTS